MSSEAEHGVRVSGSKCEVLDPRQSPRWNEFVNGHADATIFHTAEWCNVLSESYGYVPQYVCRSEQGHIDCAMPILEIDSILTGRRGVSLPFTDECCALVTPGCDEQELFKDAISLGKERNWKYFEARSGPEKGPGVQFLSHDLDLERGSETLFKGFDSAVRRGIRKAESSGVKISIETSSEGLGEYYRLHRLTRRRHGAPPQPFSFFSNIAKYIFGAGLGFVVLAEHAGKSIAAAVFFHFRRRGIYKFGASDFSDQRLRANNLVMWEGIKELVRRGQKTMSFGRTSIGNEGLRRFKLGWGAREGIISYRRISTRTGEQLSQRDNASGAASYVFRFLPLWVNQAAGSIVYRHLA